MSQSQVQDQWRQRTEEVRAVLRSLGRKIPDCLEGEREDCGGTDQEHLASMLGLVLAGIEHTTMDLNEATDGQALALVIHAYENERDNNISCNRNHRTQPGDTLHTIARADCGCSPVAIY
ncbi:hypothetical protein [Natronoglycomyces albus]|uniref:Uncharacterized protein n=1 Tax=Natronoglycomyces albus TaxID=2811108 RepID=A0A895XUU6_9ACTN|nr:hypothetical protein [Natronoglycomyces albus]QSB07155.1 hypothetical protein JQS30_17080 [Natronoglycomyces albus]